MTGGRGFLGRHLARTLAERGDEVRILAHRPPSRPVGLDVRVGDVRERDVVDRAVAGSHAVIHLVSNFRHAGSDDVAHAINVEGTRHVVEACLRHGVERLVHCSTVGVHGDVRQVPARETTPYRPGDEYQRTKLLAEEMVRALAGERGLPTVVVRPMSMYGPGDRRMLKLFRMVGSGWFPRVGDGRALFHPAYVDDVVRGFLLALDRDEALGDVFIVGGEEYLPLNDLVAAIAAEMGVRCRSVPIPMAPMIAAARICEAVFPPLGLEPPLHRRRLSFYRNNRAFDIAKARRRLGYRPEVPLREGLRRTIDWYRSQGWL